MNEKYYLLGFCEKRHYVFCRNKSFNCFTNLLTNDLKYIINLVDFDPLNDFIYCLENEIATIHKFDDLLRTNDLILVDRMKYQTAIEIPWSIWKDYYAYLFREQRIIYDTCKNDGLFLVGKSTSDTIKYALVRNKKNNQLSQELV